MWNDIQEVYQEAGNSILKLAKNKRKSDNRQHIYCFARKKENKFFMKSFHRILEQTHFKRVKYQSLESKVLIKGKTKRDSYENIIIETDKAMHIWKSAGTPRTHRILNKITIGIKSGNERPIKIK